MTVERDVTEYAAAARRHGAATEVGDAAAANEAFRELDSRWSQLRASRTQWQQAFLDLLADPSPWVRLWTASHALHVDSERAAPVLEVLTSEQGLCGFTAQVTLEAWKKAQLGTDLA